ncbi:unnamed protein product [Brassica oleracea var. botrytis]
MVEKLVTSELHRMQSTREREERETVVKHLVSLSQGLGFHTLDRVSLKFDE